MNKVSPSSQIHSGRMSPEQKQKQRHEMRMVIHNAIKAQGLVQRALPETLNELMPDVELCILLALALGWRMTDIRDLGLKTHISVEGKPFNYASELIAFAVARRYNCFPHQEVSGYWTTRDRSPLCRTPQKAIAIYVIQDFMKQR